ncbi:M23 family metallopeptidase [Reyranella sp.]|uniref:M23 family metallopeptidase n=1 Tax=Reyranella sp. TaxID=1929291 RepID=UPI00272FEA8B|nr:M23 family metallopeptidase [Reyranella sp.]MDP2378559.1 M23 family metallopeptidase [Reyranella sp.]
MTTRDERAQRWRTVRTFVAATLAVSMLQLFCAPGLIAQVKAPSKKQLRAPAKAVPTADVQPFSIGSDGSVVEQLVSLKVDPADAQAAADAVSKALGQPDVKAASSGRATLASLGADKPKRLVALQLFSASSLAVELERTADGTFGFKLAPGATESDDQRVSTVPSATSVVGSGARSLVAGSVTLVKASSATLAASLAPAGASSATLTELTQALAGFAPGGAKVEVLQGRTVDGAPRILLASLGDGQNQQSFWWFAPPNQPDGWFDEQGRRLGGTALADPRPGARISSPFGVRRYYGRKSGGGFHNGIDFEGKTGAPIFAAADGVINHQGWYFNYGRTVKISHADNFESLYAHMSRFANGMGPGSRVRKSDLIGYVGSTGRSTGAHLHFSVIVNGKFVDPAPYISQKGGNSTLNGEALVAYRQWQQEVRQAGNGRGPRSEDQKLPGLQGADPWSRNPFSTQGPDRL